MAKYGEKAKSNYEAKLPIYLYYCCVYEKEPTYSCFIKYEIDECIIEEYAAGYLQSERTKLIKGIPIDTIYDFIETWKKDDLFKYKSEEYIKDFQNVLSKRDFDILIKKQACSYCGISLGQINQLGNDGKLQNKRADTRGYSLEIDRINPNKEYTNDNCCMSCYWCNNAKTDEFFVDEFKEIARGINLVWGKRLGSEKIVFPEKSDIWNRR